MNRLILMRHGEAEPRAPSGEDFDRSLTPEGRDEARSVGRALAEAGFRPDRVLVSAAVRARETWEAAVGSFARADVEHRADLFGASADAMLAAAKAENVDTVMLVVHNPGVHALALRLAEAAAPPDPERARQIRNGFPTGAAAVFGFSATGVNCEALFTPAAIEDGAA